ncbi:metallophosphoesterase family protein [Pseudohaliea rubra]|uniref:Putative phosphohydrolase, Icc family n=1 Tax=Pseudohaliea rubra DSM 19751 TaxID=1265313 RepID=A0A095VR82_9GAMM|nr:metallophosphoesterase [Pseudohaliea rubra]KGE03972.1 putative phosphohydrolase, Icc family [Pseudohaliea rubra DSM 19751]
MAQNFIHLSDLHLTSLAGVQARELFSKRFLGYLSWRRRRRLEHRRERLDALVADFAGDGEPELVITGDLTHIGLEREFQAAAEWLAALAPPSRVALVPGNHDATVPASLDYQARYWGAYLAGDDGPGYPTLRVRGTLAFIGLNSAVATAPALATGRVDGAQLARLPALLAACRERGLFRVVYLHHCPLAGVDSRRKHLVNHAAVAGTLAAGGAELILHGHGHRDQRHELETIDGVAPVMAAPSASAAGRGDKPAATYHRFAVTRGKAGWELAITTRGFAAGAETVATLAEESRTLSRSR